MLLALQAELAQELEAGQGGLQPLTGRWWRKRWSKDKATCAMDHLLKLLEVSCSHSIFSIFLLAGCADQSKLREGRHQGMEPIARRFETPALQNEQGSRIFKNELLQKLLPHVGGPPRCSA